MNTANIIKSLKWVQFNLGRTEPNTFEHAVYRYMAAAIQKLDEQETELRRLRAVDDKPLKYDKEIAYMTKLKSKTANAISNALLKANAPEDELTSLYSKLDVETSILTMLIKKEHEQ